MTLWIEFNECDEFKTFSNKYLCKFLYIHVNSLSFPQHPVISITTHFLQIFKMFSSHIKNVSTIYEIMLYLI